MKSWEVLREAIDTIGVKHVAARLNLSPALIYKWCQEPGAEGSGASGALNPLDRLLSIWHATKDARLVNWLCHEADGFFVQNPAAKPGAAEQELLATTQTMVGEFSTMLSEISRSIGNDGVISAGEADRIRQAWERLKSNAERFAVACEQGLYSKPS